MKTKTKTKTFSLSFFFVLFFLTSGCGSVDLVPLSNLDASFPSPGNPDTQPSSPDLSQSPPDLFRPSDTGPPSPTPDATISNPQDALSDTQNPISNSTGGTMTQGTGGTSNTGTGGVQGTGGAGGVQVINGLAAEYFDSVDLSGRSVKRIDASINFDWSLGPPDGVNVNRDNFSVRWTGFVTPRFSEAYTFYTLADDGVRVWVDDVLLIDDWTSLSLPESTGSVVLSAGKAHKLRVEYYDMIMHARVRLSWSSPSEPKATVPSSVLTVP